MQIGVLREPQSDPLWPAVEYYLEPAAKRGDVPILEQNEVVWLVLVGEELLGAATARLTVEDFGEVVLVGGKDHRRWIDKLDTAIGEWMAREGMKSVRAYGRKGWVRVLKNWAVIGKEKEAVGFERLL